MDTAEAKALYDAVTSIEEFDSSLQLPPSVAERTALFHGMGEALDDCSISNDGRLFHAPSPWHAYFALHYSFVKARKAESAVFFRGHGIAGLSASTAGLYRDDMTPDLTRRARLAVDILSLLAERKEIIKAKGTDPRVLARTIAQHYGIRTSLLDVTLDPSVAVYFASLGDHEGECAAFVFDWNYCQLSGIGITIPPVSPWSRRLTVQRGFFLDLTKERELPVEDIPFEVRFPRMQGFEVRRAGKLYVPWPIDEPAVTDLIAWVMTAAAENDSISDAIVAEIEKRDRTRGLLNRQCEIMFGYVPSASDAPSEALKKLIEKSFRQYLVDSCFALETFINYLCLRGGGLDSERIMYLFESNRSVFESYLDVAHLLRKEGIGCVPIVDSLLKILGRE